MELKEYQEKTLGVLDQYLTRLREKFDLAAKAKETLDKAGIPLPSGLLDYPTQAWDQCRVDGLLPIDSQETPYSTRTDPTGQYIPSICLKIPTGGGKTLLGLWGARAILQKFVRSNRGFLLWIVRSEAIYAQTKRQLTDRNHPYRQTLDRLAAGADRVLILEKDDPLNAADVREHLCVMLLILASANRQTKEQLRMFQMGKRPWFLPLRK